MYCNTAYHNQSHCYQPQKSWQRFMNIELKCVVFCQWHDRKVASDWSPNVTPSWPFRVMAISYFFASGDKTQRAMWRLKMQRGFECILLDSVPSTIFHSKYQNAKRSKKIQEQFGTVLTYSVVWLMLQPRQNKTDLDKKTSIICRCCGATI